MAKINAALEKKYGVNLSIEKLFDHIRQYLADKYSFDKKDAFISEAHYFRGRYRAEQESSQSILLDERKFEDELIENDVVFHYKHLRRTETSSGKELIMEKGVDVWFALEAYELTLSKDFDFVVLMTGDADHEMLVKKIKTLKTRVVLLTCNMDRHSMTSRLLKDEATDQIELSDYFEQGHSFLNQLTFRV